MLLRLLGAVRRSVELHSVVCDACNAGVGGAGALELDDGDYDDAKQ